MRPWRIGLRVKTLLMKYGRTKVPLLDPLDVRLGEELAQGREGAVEALGETLGLLLLQPGKLPLLALPLLPLAPLPCPALEILVGEDVLLAQLEEGEHPGALLLAVVHLVVEGGDALEQGRVQLAAVAGKVLEGGAEARLGFCQLLRGALHGARAGSRGMGEVHLPRGVEKPVQRGKPDGLRGVDQAKPVLHDPREPRDVDGDSRAQRGAEVIEAPPEHLVGLGEPAEQLQGERLAHAEGPAHGLLQRARFLLLEKCRPVPRAAEQAPGRGAQRLEALQEGVLEGVRVPARPPAGEQPQERPVHGVGTRVIEDAREIGKPLGQPRDEQAVAECPAVDPPAQARRHGGQRVHDPPSCARGPGPRGRRAAAAACASAAWATWADRAASGGAP